MWQYGEEAARLGARWLGDYRRVYGCSGEEIEGGDGGREAKVIEMRPESCVLYETLCLLISRGTILLRSVRDYIGWERKWDADFSAAEHEYTVDASAIVNHDTRPLARGSVLGIASALVKATDSTGSAICLHSMYRAEIVDSTEGV